MRNLRLGALGLVALALSACAVLDAPSVSEVPGEKTNDLCVQYYGFPSARAPIRAELEKRSAVPETDWAQIDRRQIQIGMNACAALAAWGNPSDIHETATGSGDFIQWVYGDPLYGAQYLYFENGVITSFQN